MAQKADNSATKDALVAQEMAAGANENAQTMAKWLALQQPAIEQALPKNIGADRFTRIVMTTVRTNPRLLTCTPMSILAAAMQAAQLGLEPGSGLGQAYIIPYGSEATFQMGYKGIVKLIHNSGEVSGVWAEAVYKGDLFKVVMGTSPGIHHEPDFSVEGRGTKANVTHVYAVAQMKDGGTQFAVMSFDEIEKHAKRYSKAYNKKDSPWQDDFGWVEMAKKTVVLRLAKMLPLSAETQAAINTDNTVRREITVDMTTLGDAAEEKVSPAVLGLEAEAVVEGEDVLLPDEVSWEGQTEE